MNTLKKYSSWGYLIGALVSGAKFTYDKCKSAANQYDENMLHDRSGAYIGQTLVKTKKDAIVLTLNTHMWRIFYKTWLWFIPYISLAKSYYDEKYNKKQIAYNEEGIY